MNPTKRRISLLILPLCAALFLGAVSHSSADDDFTAQRALFVQTRTQLQQSHSSATSNDAMKKAITELQSYPLYPYLQLQQLSTLIEDNVDAEAIAAQVDDFLKQYPDTVAAEQLRSQWLDELATSERWLPYLRYYSAASASKLQQCEFIEALHQTGQKKAALLETDKLWLTTDMPDACDAAFSRWLASDHRNEPLIWMRLQLALERNQEKLARSLAVQIGAPYKLQAEYALLLLRDPAALSDLLPQIAQQPEASATIALAIENLARRNLDIAQKLWLQTSAAGQLSPSDNFEVRRAIGRQQIAQFGPDALPWLLQYDPDGSDRYLLEWRIRLALGDGNWEDIAHWIAQLPADLANTSRWNYWRARALLQGDPAQHQHANDMLISLAKERSYYGFLAADRLQKPYLLNDEPTASSHDITEIEGLPAVARAREFFLLDEAANARREWQAAMRAMSTGKQQAAGLLAERWGWYDQMIRSANVSGSHNDIQLRFPLGFRNDMYSAAKRTSLPLHWLFAITRQESAFMPDARSSVGALGLMQLMPATAKHVARGERIHIDTYDLLQPKTNIRLGSSYLRDLAQRFNGNRILATAAYNAGPNRISQILREQTHPLSADVWIELLPYRETREYVQSVLAFSVIYSQRLGKPEPLLNSSERQIGAESLQVGSAK
ncbi:MAG TPA: transglycosylase SLT domain-containing protein [Spongiibacteraceae bacterium]|nr:transglycosylase SLT domain-containing protein [Spongiibacteraceae bacterium]